MSDKPEVDQPGLAALRELALRVAGLGKDRKASFSKDSITKDSVAGLTVTVTGVPDGMANGLLAGVNPVYGLYANMVGPILGGVLGASALMVINSTSAAALVGGQALPGGMAAADRADALFLMVVIAGVIQIGCGLLRLGALTRFISYSVMTGFVAGIAVVLALSQIPTVTGTSPEEGNSVTETFDVLRHPGDIHLPTLGIAAIAVVLVIGLRRTPLRTAASLIAIAVPAIVVAGAGLDEIALVRDVGSVAGGIPLPGVPDVSNLTSDVITGAIAVAVVVLVQGAGIGQSLASSPTPGSVSRDFAAQGAGNVAAGLFSGLPVGGSLKGTAVNIGSGAVGRWAAISSGLFTAVIVLAVPGLIERVSMPALGALLIVASVGSLRPTDVVNVWRAGWPSQLAAATTFVSTLLLPIQAAVGIGVVLAAFLYVSNSSTDISVVELIEDDEEHLVERNAPATLPSQQVTVLDVYGNLFYAGARTMERQLPDVGDAERPVVLLRLRGRTTLGATLVDVLATYGDQLHEAGGRLYLTGLGEVALDHLHRAGFRPSKGFRLYEAVPTLGRSTRRALVDAESWLLSSRDDDEH